MTEAITPRERVSLALERQRTDRVPIAMVCSGINPAARRELECYLQQRRGIGVNAYLASILDIAGCQPPYIGPRLAAGTDYWGVRREPVSYGLGAYDEISEYPLARVQSIRELDEHTWPSPDWWEYDSLPVLCRQLRRERDYALLIGNGNPFETTWYLRGFERTLADLTLNPELVTEILRRVTGFYIAFFRRALKAADGAIDLVFTADDIGGQRGLLMSLPMWEALIKPHHARLNAALHELGVRVMYHSDGGVTAVVPGLIEAGIDILQALQFEAAGMDPVALKRSYGDRLCFEGGVSVQQTLPFGTPEDVAQEVRQRIRVLAAGGGYILGPSHAIQDGTPPANIVALFDTAMATGLP
jgi:uroporphyrinogen decarboxylase